MGRGQGTASRAPSLQERRAQSELRAAGAPGRLRRGLRCDRAAPRMWAPRPPGRAAARGAPARGLPALPLLLGLLAAAPSGRAGRCLLLRARREPRIPADGPTLPAPARAPTGFRFRTRGAEGAGSPRGPWGETYRRPSRARGWVRFAGLLVSHLPVRDCSRVLALSVSHTW